MSGVATDRRCPRCGRAVLTRYLFNGIAFAYCLPISGGCGYGERCTEPAARPPRDLFEWAGIAVELSALKGTPTHPKEPS